MVQGFFTYKTMYMTGEGLVFVEAKLKEDIGMYLKDTVVPMVRLLFNGDMQFMNSKRDIRYTLITMLKPTTPIDRENGCFTDKFSR